MSLQEFNQIYYTKKNFCVNDESKRSVSQKLGQSLYGDRLENIPYNFKFGKDVNCENVCTVTYDKDEIKSLIKFIKQLYTQRWFGDHIPVIFCPIDDKFNFIRENCTTNFLVGCGINDITSIKDNNIECLINVYIK